MRRVKNKKYFLFDKPEDLDNGVIQPRNEVEFEYVDLDGWNWDGDNRKVTVNDSKEDILKWLDSLPFDFMYTLEEFENSEKFGSCLKIFVYDNRYPKLPKRYDHTDSVFKSFTNMCKKRGFRFFCDSHDYIPRGLINQPAPDSWKDVYKNNAHIGDEIWIAVNKEYKDRSKHIDMVKAKIVSFNKSNIGCEYYNDLTNEIVNVQLAYDKHFIMNGSTPEPDGSKANYHPDYNLLKERLGNMYKVVKHLYATSNSDIEYLKKECGKELFE